MAETTFNLKSILIPIFVIYFLVAGCTYTITMVQSSGKASDMVDETSTNAPSTSVEPTLSIPTKLP